MGWMSDWTWTDTLKLVQTQIWVWESPVQSHSSTHWEPTSVTMCFFVPKFWVTTSILCFPVQVIDFGEKFHIRCPVLFFSNVELLAKCHSQCNHVIQVTPQNKRETYCSLAEVVLHEIFDFSKPNSENMFTCSKLWHFSWTKETRTVCKASNNFQTLIFCDCAMSLSIIQTRMRFLLSSSESSHLWTEVGSTC
jgi:hypothetical protein